MIQSPIVFLSILFCLFLWQHKAGFLMIDHAPLFIETVHPYLLKLYIAIYRNCTWLFTNYRTLLFTDYRTLLFTDYINAYSPQYGELLWKKNITLKPSIFTYEGTKAYSEIPSLADELKQDNVVYNLVSKKLDQIYMEAMNLVWQQIDVAEMKTIAEQAKKADKKGR